MVDKFSMDFQATLGSPWGHLGVILESLCGRFGAPSGLALGSFWVALGLQCGCLGIILGAVLNILELSGGIFGVIVPWFGVMFGSWAAI